MVGIDEIKEAYQRVCVEEGRYLALNFCMPEKVTTEFGTVRLIGKNDSLENALITASHIGNICVVMTELSKKNSGWINAKRSNRIAIMEEILTEIGQARFRAMGRLATN